MRLTEQPELLPNLVYGSKFNGQAHPMVSVVIPAYCESGNLSRLYQELAAVLAIEELSWELIIVDDGSDDGTWNEIFALHQEDTRVKGLRLSRNFGHQYALFAGLSNAAGQVVITMDADLQHPPAIIPELLRSWRQGNKIVHTVRIDHDNTLWRKKFTSRLFYRIFSLLSGVELSAGMADFRLMDRQVVNELLQFNEGHLFLRGLIHWVGYPSSKLEFCCRERFSGKTKYNLRRMLKFAWTGVTSFSVVPLRFAIILGSITSFAAFCGLAYAVWGKLFDRAVPGWASVVGIESLLFGILFMMLGIIGEYIGRILEEVRARPRYIVHERLGFTHRDPNLPDINGSKTAVFSALG
jgi:glycosyltransferase involved in cell wall biosynthesis